MKKLFATIGMSMLCGLFAFNANAGNIVVGELFTPSDSDPTWTTEDLSGDYYIVSNSSKNLSADYGYIEISFLFEPVGKNWMEVTGTELQTTPEGNYVYSFSASGSYELRYSAYNTPGISFTFYAGTYDGQAVETPDVSDFDKPYEASASGTHEYTLQFSQKDNNYGSINIKTSSTDNLLGQFTLVNTAFSNAADGEVAYKAVKMSDGTYGYNSQSSDLPLWKQFKFTYNGTGTVTFTFVAEPVSGEAEGPFIGEIKIGEEFEFSAMYPEWSIKLTEEEAGPFYLLTDSGIDLHGGTFTISADGVEVFNDIVDTTDDGDVYAWEAVKGPENYYGYNGDVNEDITYTFKYTNYASSPIKFKLSPGVYTEYGEPVLLKPGKVTTPASGNYAVNLANIAVTYEVENGTLAQNGDKSFQIFRNGTQVEILTQQSYTITGNTLTFNVASITGAEDTDTNGSAAATWSIDVPQGLVWIENTATVNPAQSVVVEVLPGVDGTVSPAVGEVDELTTVTVTYSGALSMNQTSNVGVTVNGQPATASVSGNTLTITVPPSEDESITIEVPEALYFVGEGNSQLNNGQTFMYTVKEVVPVTYMEDDATVLIPENGNLYTLSLTEIMVGWDDITIEEKSEAKGVLSLPTGGDSKEVEWYLFDSSALAGYDAEEEVEPMNNNSIIFDLTAYTFDDEYEPVYGTYTLQIPAGIVADSETGDLNKGQTVRVHFLEGIYGTESPAAGEVNELLEYVTVSFDGTSLKENDSVDLSCTINGTEVTPLVEGTTLTFDLTDFVDEKDINFVIPATMYIVDDTYLNYEIEFGYTVDTTGINKIESNNNVKVVYNLQGVKVSEKNLVPGIYIINGKKTVVK